VNLSGLRRALAYRDARNTLIVGIFLRIPVSGIGVVLTLHVVQTLGRSYADAGLLVTAQTVCLAASGPWRGRLLDRIGLRRVMLPCITVNAACWTVAPLVGFLPLLAIAAVSGLFNPPVFGIVRQALMAAVPDDERRAALSLDSSSAEVSFMIGPVIGVFAATHGSTGWAMFGFGLLGVVTGAALLVLNPPLRDESAGASVKVPRTEWMSLHFLAILGVAGTTVFLLGGTDIAIIAGLREFGAPGSIGLVMAVWGLGSMIGGLVYGAWPHSLPSGLLLVGLALVTIPAAFATGPVSLGLLVAVAGLLCAPTITATADELSRIVPESARGEAMGWHGSVMTAGSSLGAPFAGFAIDRTDFSGGFVTMSMVGLAVAVLAVGLIARFRVGASPELAAEADAAQQPVALG
jgi:MFS family permease